MSRENQADHKIGWRSSVAEEMKKHGTTWKAVNNRVLEKCRFGSVCSTLTGVSYSPRDQEILGSNPWLVAHSCFYFFKWIQLELGTFSTCLAVCILEFGNNGSFR